MSKHVMKSVSAECEEAMERLTRSLDGKDCSKPVVLARDERTGQAVKYRAHSVSNLAGDVFTVAQSVPNPDQIVKDLLAGSRYVVECGKKIQLVQNNASDIKHLLAKAGE